MIFIITITFGALVAALAVQKTSYYKRRPLLASICGSILIAGVISLLFIGMGLRADSDTEANILSNDTPELRYHGPYADAVDGCVAMAAGWPENEDNTRHEFLALFDPSRASVEEETPWAEDGTLHTHVRVSIPRTAAGYYQGRLTRRPIDDEANCDIFRRGDHWWMAFGID